MIYLPIILLPIILFSRILVGGEALYWGTPALQFIPWRVLAWQMLEQGIFPGWNPLNGMGAPLAANYQLALFYPPGWLLYVAAALGGVSWLAWAHTLVAVLHLVWAGFGMTLLTRRLGLAPLAQVISSLAFALGAYFVSRLGFFSMVWTGSWFPWVILGASRIGCPGQKTETPRLIRLLPLAASTAMMLLAGHAQLSWYILLFAAGWVSVGGWSDGGSKRALLALGLFGAAVVSAAVLAAVQLLPTAEYLLQSQRMTAVGYEMALTYSFWGWRLLTFFAPDLFGNPGRGDYWGYANYWEDAGYIGLLPLLLALSTLVVVFSRKNAESAAGGRRTLLRFLWLGVGLSILLALGKNTPVFPVLYRYVPTFNMFNAPTRFLIWTVFCLSLLAGIAVQSWRAPHGKGLYWMRLATAGGCAVTLGAFLTWWLMREVQPTFIRATALAGLSAVVAGLLTLFQPGLEGSRSHKLWQWLVVAFIGADLLAAGWLLNPATDQSFYNPGVVDLSSIKSLQAGERIYFHPTEEYRLKYQRYLAFDDYYTEPDWQNARRALLSNLNILDGVPLVNNFDPIVPGRYARLMEHLNSLDAPQREPWLALMNVGLDEKIVPSSPQEVRFERINGAQRFRWLPCAQNAGSEDEAWM
ncbi:MAG: hypothetical protein U1B80_03240, partial [Anaerolineaceae bacterium]|nr:hypothetical protein [Anaerolineaceae bacterium]